jgi:hypothetical protein
MLFTAPVGEFGFLHAVLPYALPVVHRPRAGHTHSSLLSDHETYLTERCRPELAVRIVKWRSPVSFSTTMTVIMWLLDEDALPEIHNAQMQRCNEPRLCAGKVRGIETRVWESNVVERGNNRSHNT